jgi:hypothetical protein
MVILMPIIFYFYKLNYLILNCFNEPYYHIYSKFKINFEETLVYSNFHTAASNFFLFEAIINYKISSNTSKLDLIMNFFMYFIHLPSLNYQLLIHSIYIMKA